MRLTQLDILRAIAVFMVLGSHMDAPPSYVDSVTTWIMTGWRQVGGLGVDLFFVLSGFLVSGLMFREYREYGSINIKRFLVRRGLKIYPAFYVFLVATVPLRIWRGNTFSLSEILCESLFLQNYGPRVWGHTWSLAVEEHFYLLLALLFFVLVRRGGAKAFSRLSTWFIVTATIVLFLRVLTWLLLPYKNQTHFVPTHLRIDALLFGVLLSYYYHMDPQKLAFVSRVKISIAIVSLALIATSFFLPWNLFGYVITHYLVYIGCGGVLLVSLDSAMPTAAPSRRLISTVAFVGRHSYSIYLWHFPVLIFGLILARKLMGGEPNYYVSLAGYMTASIVFGIVMAMCVETPVLKIRDRLFPSKTSKTIRMTPIAENKMPGATASGTLCNLSEAI